MGMAGACTRKVEGISWTGRDCDDRRLGHPMNPIARTYLTLIETYLALAPKHRGKGALAGLLLRPLGDVVVRTAYGFLMRADVADVTNRMSLVGYGGHVVRDEVASLREGTAFVDVGANAGLFSILASKAVGPRGVVLGFEPHEAIYRQLVHNIALNGCGNIQTFRAAISEETRCYRMSYDPRHSGASRVLPDGTRDGDSVQAYRFVDVPSIREAIEGKSVTLKVDVEGHELRVLRSVFSSNLRCTIEKVIVEVDEQLLR
jgi:FkbM family methyltransferase